MALSNPQFDQKHFQIENPCLPKHLFHFRKPCLNNQGKVIFISGATGYVGCHLAHSFLAVGHTVVALAREGGRRGVPEKRVQQTIAAVDEEMPVSFDRLIVIPGDVTDSSAEIMAKIHARINRPFDEVWHCVACFKFKEEEREEIEKTNLGGVHHMLDLVLNLNGNGPKPRYFHISTAYSSGRAEGTVPETFIRHGNQFRSLYEWSKHEGEAIVAKYQQENGIDATIFRPSIIVGSPTTTVINYSAYYQVLESLYRLFNRIVIRMGEAFDGNLKIRIPGSYDTRINFVPIEYVSKAMLLIVDEPKLVNDKLKVFNIVNENPVPMSLLHKVASASLGVYGIQIVPPAEFEKAPQSKLERILARCTAFQLPYMNEELHWSMVKFRQLITETQLPPLAMDEAFLSAINKIFFDKGISQKLLTSASQFGVIPFQGK